MEIDIGSEFTIVMHTFSKDSRFSSYVWWPKLDGEIEILVRTCEQCQQSPPHAPNSVVLHRLCIDIAGRICGKNFLIIVDTFFTWLEVCVIKNTTFEAEISSLRQIFSIHGLPDSIVSHNGAQFTSQAVRSTSFWPPFIPPLTVS
ncbi:hypothetical protein Tsp_00576 [Trichinella spiralis]|uniref:hypothetical protein n=1 Tax=Trichinella spiralis TaxID=6334 RepID=UPI0001EFBE5D|nr:hypothetical protein Tsp_00576 [Trichinella spiralis]